MWGWILERAWEGGKRLCRTGRKYRVREETHRKEGLNESMEWEKCKIGKSSNGINKE